MVRKMSLKALSILVFSTIFFLSFNPARAYEPNDDRPMKGARVAEEKKEESKSFDAGKLIIEHISDSHEWHLWGEGGSAVAIPLPVIIYSNKGLDVFMSSHFEEGQRDITGKNTYRLEENHIKVVNETGAIDEEASAKIMDLSITKNVASLLFGAGLMLWMFLSVAKAYKKREGKAPKGLQSFLEPLILFVRDDVAKTSIGPKYEKYMPYLLTAFFFIFINNLLGLVPIFPGGANLTGNIAVTMILAAITLIVTLLSGNAHYWRHIFAMPGVPIPILIILTPIEIMGVFLKPFVLMIRLFANMTAGHIIALAFFSLIFIFGEMSPGAGYGVSVVSVAFTVFMGMLELLVAFLQAYVFTLLSAIYFGAAIEEHHHKGDHEHDAHPDSQIDIV
ncbi:MAG TPA: F0F1 ATP synthase subunit A [Bacteroidia bacterium]|jgi:F-type H+-transporting ATPase subunit a|nr:F0F1 ATP synthase subunit A [Bacteroidia bacterium]